MSRRLFNFYQLFLLYSAFARRISDLDLLCKLCIVGPNSADTSCEISPSLCADKRIPVDYSAQMQISFLFALWTGLAACNVNRVPSSGQADINRKTDPAKSS